MKLTDQIKQCRTPQEALLLLARAVDQTNARIDEFGPPDAWDTDLEWADDLDLQPEPADDGRAVVEGGDVIVKPVDAHRQAVRAHFASTNRIAEFVPLMSEDDVIDAYVKGGPRWLYYGVGREVVMEMPVGLRQALVADILLDSPSEAAEIGADILKFSFEEGAREEAQLDYQRVAPELGPSYKAAE